MRRNSFKVGPSGFTIISPKPQAATTTIGFAMAFCLAESLSSCSLPRIALRTATMKVPPKVPGFFCISSTVSAVI